MCSYRSYKTIILKSFQDLFANSVSVLESLSECLLLKTARFIQLYYNEHSSGALGLPSQKDHLKMLTEIYIQYISKLHMRGQCSFFNVWWQTLSDNSSSSTNRDLMQQGQLNFRKNKHRDEMLQIRVVLWRRKSSYKSFRECPVVLGQENVQVFSKIQ